MRKRKIWLLYINQPVQDCYFLQNWFLSISSIKISLPDFVYNQKQTGWILYSAIKRNRGYERSLPAGISILFRGRHVPGNIDCKSAKKSCLKWVNFEPSGTTSKPQKLRSSWEYFKNTIRSVSVGIEKIRWRNKRNRNNFIKVDGFIKKRKKLIFVVVEFILAIFKNFCQSELNAVFMRCLAFRKRLVFSYLIGRGRLSFLAPPIEPCVRVSYTNLQLIFQL